MMVSFSSTIAILASWFALTKAYVTLGSFPQEVVVGQSYDLTWYGTSDYNYTLWLVLAEQGEDGWGWDKVQTLLRAQRFDSLNASYTWTVPATLDPESYYALWLDGIPSRFDGSSYANKTEWFQVTGMNGTTVSTSSGAVASTTSSATTTGSGASHVPSSGSSNEAASSTHQNTISGGAIAGIVIGVLAALALIAVAAVLFVRRRRQAGFKRREAVQRASRLEPVMQESSPAIEMHPRKSQV